MEKWKFIEIKGLEYKISNHGRIIGLSSGKILKTRLNKDGYVVATVGKSSEGRTSEVLHRLVAKLFVNNPYPEEFNEVNHKDFNRTNNYYENLEWTNHLDNVAYTVQHKRNSTAIYDYMGKNNPNYGNNTLKLKYKNDPELAKIKCSRPKEQNGRAKKVKLLDINRKIIKEFDYIGGCAEYLIENDFTKAKIYSISYGISKSIKTQMPYLGHFYEFVA